MASRAVAAERGAARPTINGAVYSEFCGAVPRAAGFAESVGAAQSGNSGAGLGGDAKAELPVESGGALPDTGPAVPVIASIESLLAPGTGESPWTTKTPASAGIGDTTANSSVDLPIQPSLSNEASPPLGVRSSGPDGATIQSSEATIQTSGTKGATISPGGPKGAVLYSAASPALQTKSAAPNAQAAQNIVTAAPDEITTAQKVAPAVDGVKVVCFGKAVPIEESVTSSQVVGITGSQTPVSVSVGIPMESERPTRGLGLLAPSHAFLASGSLSGRDLSQGPKPLSRAASAGDIRRGVKHAPYAGVCAERVERFAVDVRTGIGAAFDSKDELRQLDPSGPILTPAPIAHYAMPCLLAADERHAAHAVAHSALRADPERLEKTRSDESEKVGGQSQSSGQVAPSLLMSFHAVGDTLDRRMGYSNGSVSTALAASSSSSPSASVSIAIRPSSELKDHPVSCDRDGELALALHREMNEGAGPAFSGPRHGGAGRPRRVHEMSPCLETALCYCGLLLLLATVGLILALVFNDCTDFSSGRCIGLWAGFIGAILLVGTLIYCGTHGPAWPTAFCTKYCPAALRDRAIRDPDANSAVFAPRPPFEDTPCCPDICSCCYHVSIVYI
jgi:hypothetical protein